ncbi:MAG: hypothetical protein MJ195_02785 [Mycoplasmoidaceae bacterium]|nr:hypothetical protein [Mycoplasmoidaceae bacterium]
MKLKSKLIGILGTAVVATTALTTVVACKYSNDQPTYSNTIIFKGERYLAPVAGSRTFVISGFSLYKELGKDNYDAIDVYASTNQIKANIVEGTRPTTKDFDVKVTAQIFDSSLNQKIGFNLVFVFYKNSEVARKFSISSFSFNYRAV